MIDLGIKISGIRMLGEDAVSSRFSSESMSGTWEDVCGNVYTADITTAIRRQAHRLSTGTVTVL